MSKSKKPDYSHEPRKFEDGDSCLILRPNLWAGAVGEVVGFKEGLHRIMITAKADGSTFSHFYADVRGGELELYL